MYIIHGGDVENQAYGIQKSIKNTKKGDDFMGQMPITRANSQIVSHQQWISYVQKPK